MVYRGVADTPRPCRDTGVEVCEDSRPWRKSTLRRRGRSFTVRAKTREPEGVWRSVAAAAVRALTNDGRDVQHWR